MAVDKRGHYALTSWGEQLAEPLRHHEPPVVGILRDGRLLLDCRTLADHEVDEVAAAVLACR